MTPESPALEGKRSNSLAGCAFGLYFLFIAQILIGLLLETHYRASASSAYQDVHSIQFGGMAMIRGFHYWGSAILIAGSLLLLAAMLVARWFNGGHNRLWLGTALLYLTALLAQVTGNVLPFDRHGVQTAVVESGVARQTPLGGGFIANLILGGSQFNATTVERWHIAHIGLVLLLGAAVGLLLWSGRTKVKGGAPLWAPIVVSILAALMAPAPLGNGATPADYNSYNAQVSWYTWPLHGSLNLWSAISPSIGWVGSVVFPGLFALLIVAAPWLVKRVSPKTVQWIFGGLALYFLCAAAIFGGRFAPLVGNRDPALAASNGTVSNNYDKVLYDQGRQIFNANACVGCHGKDGRPGGAGPSLLGIGKEHSDPAWYQKFIHDPKSEKPNTMMPAFPDLTNQQTRAIAEFLIHQK